MTRDQARANTLFVELLDRFTEAVCDERNALTATYGTRGAIKARREAALSEATERAQRLRECLIDAYVAALVQG